MKKQKYQTKEGEKFGHWEVVEPNIPGNVKTDHSLVRCECGATSKVLNRNLYNGRTKSCGQHACPTRRRAALKDVKVGDVFGHMTVVEILGSTKEGADQYPVARAMCRCDCGVEKSVRINNLRGGHTRTCGCKSWVKVVTAESIENLYTVDEKTGCWNWNNTKNQRPRTTSYNKISMSPRRAVYQIIKGDIEFLRFRISASCDNPLCVNPDHSIITPLPGRAAEKAKTDKAKKEVNIEKLLSSWR